MEGEKRCGEQGERSSRMKESEKKGGKTYDGNRCSCVDLRRDLLDGIPVPASKGAGEASPGTGSKRGNLQVPAA